MTFLNENSIFADAAAKAELIKDKDMIKDLFWICTLGILGLQAQKNRHAKLKKYLKSIDKTRINSIDDQAHDTAVMVKIAYDEGLLPPMFITEFTKLLFILKTKPDTDLDETKIRDLFNKIIWSKMIPSPRIRSETKDFLDGKANLESVVVPYYYFAKYSKIATDFKAITYAMHKNITKTVQAMKAQKVAAITQPQTAKVTTTLAGTPIPSINITPPASTSAPMLDIKDYVVSGKILTPDQKEQLKKYLEVDARKNYMAYFLLANDGVTPMSTLSEYEPAISKAIFEDLFVDHIDNVNYIIATKLSEMTSGKRRIHVSIIPFFDTYLDLLDVDYSVVDKVFDKMADSYSVSGLKDIFKRKTINFKKFKFFPKSNFLVSYYLNSFNLIDVYDMDNFEKHGFFEYFNRLTVYNGSALEKNMRSTSENFAKMMEIFASVDLEKTKVLYAKYQSAFAKLTDVERKKLTDLGVIAKADTSLPFNKVEWQKLDKQSREDLISQYLDKDKNLELVFLLFASVVGKRTDLAVFDKKFKDLITGPEQEIVSFFRRVKRNQSLVNTVQQTSQNVRNIAEIFMSKIYSTVDINELDTIMYKLGNTTQFPDMIIDFFEHWLDANPGKNPWTEIVKWPSNSLSRQMLFSANNNNFLKFLDNKNLDLFTSNNPDFTYRLTNYVRDVYRSMPDDEKIVVLKKITNHSDAAVKWLNTHLRGYAGLNDFNNMSFIIRVGKEIPALGIDTETLVARVLAQYSPDSTSLIYAVLQKYVKSDDIDIAKMTSLIKSHSGSFNEKIIILHGLKVLFGVDMTKLFLSLFEVYVPSTGYSDRFPSDVLQNMLMLYYKEPTNNTIESIFEQFSNKLMYLVLTQKYGINLNNFIDGFKDVYHKISMKHFPQKLRNNIIEKSIGSVDINNIASSRAFIYFKIFNDYPQEHFNVFYDTNIDVRKSMVKKVYELVIDSLRTETLFKKFFEGFTIKDISREDVKQTPKLLVHFGIDTTDKYEKEFGHGTPYMHMGIEALNKADTEKLLDGGLLQSLPSKLSLDVKVEFAKDPKYTTDPDKRKKLFMGHMNINGINTNVNTQKLVIANPIFLVDMVKEGYDSAVKYTNRFDKLIESSGIIDAYGWATENVSDRKTTDKLVNDMIEGIRYGSKGNDRITAVVEKFASRALFKVSFETIKNNPLISLPNRINEHAINELLKFNNFEVHIDAEKYKPKKHGTPADYLDSIKDKKVTVDDPKLTPLDLTDEQLEQLTVHYSQYLNGKHGDTAMVVLRSFEVNLSENEELKEFKEKYASTKISPAFHGTGAIAASMILRFGFRVMTNSVGGVATTGKMLGNGVYFSTALDKTLQYIGDEGYARNKGTKGYILEMDAYTGKEGSDFRVAGLGRDAIRSPEWCVFNPRAQLDIKKAHFVVMVSTRRIEELKKKYPDLVKEHGEGVFSIKDFLIEEDLKHDTKVFNFIFQDGTVPTGKGKDMPDFDDWHDSLPEEVKKKVFIGYGQSGPLVTIESKVESDCYLYNIPDTLELIRDNPEKIYTLWKKILKDLGL